MEHSTFTSVAHNNNLQPTIVDSSNELNHPVELQKCTSCKVNRKPDQFIGKRGKVINTCKQCRDKDDAQKKYLHNKQLNDIHESSPLPPNSGPRQRVYVRGSNLPENSIIKPEHIPPYCNYNKPTKTCPGDCFTVGRDHPKQKALGKSDWKTPTSIKISLEDKFKQLLDYLAAPVESYVPDYTFIDSLRSILPTKSNDPIQ
jgi:hypothetical protein